MKLAHEKPKRKKKRKKRAWTKQRIRRCWINACLDLWSILIRHRDGKCIWCGSVNNLHAHHIVSKALLGGNLAGYLDLCNGMTLCFKCHIHRLKSEPDEYIAMRDKWVNKNNYFVTYEALRVNYGIKTKITTDDLAMIYQYEFKPMVLELHEFDEQVEKIEKRYLSRIPQ